jgi:hypothetical protein
MVNKNSNLPLKDKQLGAEMRDSIINVLEEMD